MKVEPSTSVQDEEAWLTPGEYRTWRAFLDGTRAVFQALQQLQAEAGRGRHADGVLRRPREAVRGTRPQPAHGDVGQDAEPLDQPALPRHQPSRALPVGHPGITPVRPTRPA